MIPTVLNVVGGLLLLAGLALMTISPVGVLRLRRPHYRLRVQGLATGPGVIAVLASSIATQNAPTITFAALTVAFIVLSSPTSSHAIAHERRGSRGPRRHHLTGSSDEERCVGGVAGRAGAGWSVGCRSVVLGVGVAEQGRQLVLLADPRAVFLR